jgi:hypothetical protein
MGLWGEWRLSFVLADFLGVVATLNLAATERVGETIRRKKYLLLGLPKKLWLLLFFHLGA